MDVYQLGWSLMVVVIVDIGWCWCAQAVAYAWNADPFNADGWLDGWMNE